MAASFGSVSMSRDEGAVDLEAVDRQALEVGQRRVAGAEVVDGEAHAQRVQLRAAPRWRGSGRRISTLSVISSSRRRGSGRCRSSDRAHRVEQSRAARNWRRERLTAIGRPASPRALPGAHLARRPGRSTHSPSGTIRPVSSASGMNSSGGTSPCSGCCQRSSASTPTMLAAAQVDLRLVVQHELAVASSARRRRALERQALGRRRCVQRRGVELVVVAAGCLGVVHGDVGVLEQRLGVVAVARDTG